MCKHADTNTFKIAETRNAGTPMKFSSVGASITYIKKAIADIVRDAPVPVGGCLESYFWTEVGS